MRDKTDGILEADYLDAKQYAQRSAAASRLRRRFLWRAAVLVLGALVCISPAVTYQMLPTKVVWEWMVIAGGVAVGEAAYTFLLANQWDEQLRATRQRDVMVAKAREEKLAAIAALSSVTVSRDDSFPGWGSATRGTLVPPHH
ncbi:hypothetical protein [Aquincola sp. J276]|uniref:hypothetical protein n=1 Tax=Aquincola sp. J276 TaxID=2898432 RepID=UPI0021514615|nr:hypothetical protein [Aquincola sp. J276]MCR5865212.1 hypothetical protein [Aquincola sp. J276]